MAEGIEWVGVSELTSALAEIEAAVQRQTSLAVAEAAHVVEALAKAHASGRPGPNVRTGNLRRSITVVGPNQLLAGMWVAFIGPTAAYGRRVELGFNGSDSLGRSYNQPGFPFLEPAFTEALRGPVQAVFTRNWGAALSR